MEAGRTLDDGDDESTMDDKLGELGRPLVRVATMPNEELGQVAELVDRKVGRKRGLASLLPNDPDACVQDC